MKTFKQRFSIYSDAHHGRRGSGTLRHGRFKSVLVEESESAQVTVAAYIDLNPVRAGVVEDHCRVRYLTDGVIIGGKDFVDKMLNEHGPFSALRKKRGARPMKNDACGWNGLCAAGELRSVSVS